MATHKTLSSRCKRWGKLPFVNNSSERRLSWIVAVVAIQTLTFRRTKRVHPYPGAQSPVVVVAGFGWSGASALVDVLAECESANLPPVGEMRFLKAFRRVGKTRATKKWGLDAQEYAKAKAAVGRYSRHEVELNAFRYWANANHRLADFERASNDLVDALFKVRLRPRGRRRKLITAYLNAILFAVERPNKFTICDNLIPASKLGVFRHIDLSAMPPMFVLIVNRKPRDMFVDQVRHGWRSASSSYVLFFFGHLRRVIWSKFAIWRIKVPVIEVSFEELVCKDECRVEVRDAISCWMHDHCSGEVFWMPETRFFPEVSRENVGLLRRQNQL